MGTKTQAAFRMLIILGGVLYGDVYRCYSAKAVTVFA
jgi:hypothetical protein